MKKLYTALLLCVIAWTLPAAAYAAFGWRWAKSAGGTGEDHVYRTTTDAAGNVYIAGVFFGPSLVFTSTNYVYNNGSNLTGEAYIAKYNSAGVFQWVRSGGGIDHNSIYTMTVTTDPSGNVYLGGTYQGWGITWGSTVFSHSSIGAYTYVLKFDANGNVLLAKDYQNVDIASMAVDASGNMYMGGTFENTVTLGSFTLSNAFSATDIFMSKLDATGTPLWATSFSGDTYDLAYSVALSNGGDVYLAGSFTSSTLTAGTTTLINAGGYDFLLAKFSNSGSLSWIKSAGGYWDDHLNDVAVDASGNAYLSGYFFSPSFSFGSGTIYNTTTNNKNLVIAKYSAAGSELWARNAGGSSPGDLSYATAVAVDTANNVYLAGSFGSSAINFDTVTLTNIPNYIVKYNPSGTATWGIAPGGDYLNDMATDKAGGVFATGEYQFNL